MSNKHRSHDELIEADSVNEITESPREENFENPPPPEILQD
jgi:hypothetical protein